ncbi:hypothetical protein E2C01_057905 [Portunus trituberculatus]|uniref:Uncharacterized protein n=1 Tax=Portunus trituberculatus TaxID=210409 RepID=A0A5B7H1M0_PORTR|nr:hypothetical protein [Portunus trituberculatus]
MNKIKLGKIAQAHLVRAKTKTRNIVKTHRIKIQGECYCVRARVRKICIMLSWGRNVVVLQVSRKRCGLEALVKCSCSVEEILLFDDLGS